MTYVHVWRPFAERHPGVDFLLTTFESWRRSVGHFPTATYDLIATAAEATVERMLGHETLRRLCTVVTLDPLGGLASPPPPPPPLQPQSRCWLVSHTLREIGEPLRDFPFALDLFQLTTPKFHALARQRRYSLLLKVRAELRCAVLRCAIAAAGSSCRAAGPKSAFNRAGLKRRCGDAAIDRFHAALLHGRSRTPRAKRRHAAPPARRSYFAGAQLAGQQRRRLRYLARHGR